MQELHNAKCNKFLAQNVLTFLREMLQTLKQNVTNKAVRKEKPVKRERVSLLFKDCHETRHIKVFDAKIIALC